MKRSKVQEERLDFLLKQFKEDSIQYRDLRVQDTYESKRRALRSLMNIRMPKPLEENIQKVQDEFLAEELKERGIVTLEDIPTVAEQYSSKHRFANQLSIWQGDITRLAVDAIVNAANSQMLGCFIPCHGCIDNAIHSAAGIELRGECYQRMKQKSFQFGAEYEEPTGKAMLTGAYNLPANYVIHTVGPIVEVGVNDKLRKELESCYQNVMKCCLEHKLRSVAFCCISTGEFHFPRDEAAGIAVKTVCDFLAEHPGQFERIIFNVFQDEDRELYERGILW